jgi:predicted alpha/beta superfamily hydrolase
VLYMHDGQNIFDDATSFAGEWRADETAKRLIDEGKIVPLIIVAIENAGAARIDEYTPTTEPIYVADKKAIDEGKKKKEEVELEGGKGEQYAQFLITEVKPFIDQTYRTKPDRANTAVAGSSLGGLISLHLAYKHNKVFSKFGVISPSLWWDNRNLVKHFYADANWMRSCKIYFDMGTDEGGQTPERNLLYTRELAGIMSRAGLSENIAYKYTEIEGAKHNEQSWADRFDQVLLFLFGK